MDKAYEGGDGIRGRLPERRPSDPGGGATWSRLCPDVCVQK